MEKNELLEKLVLPDVPEDVQIAMMDSPDAPELLKVFLSNRHGDGWLTEKTERYMVNCPNAEKLLEVYLLAFCFDLSEVMEEEIITQHKPWTINVLMDANVPVSLNNELLLLKGKYSVDELSRYMELVKDTENVLSEEWEVQLLKHKDAEELLGKYVSLFGKLQKKAEKAILSKKDDDKLKKVYQAALEEKSKGKKKE